MRLTKREVAWNSSGHDCLTLGSATELRVSERRVATSYLKLEFVVEIEDLAPFYALCAK